VRLEIGFRAVTEEYPPEELLKQVRAAEDAGFDFVTASDHFHPWFHTGAQSSQAWILLAAAASVTRRVKLGTGVTSPFSRYHPGIVAQSFATLHRISGGRAFLGVGTGEAMNEIPLGLNWPPYRERVEILREAVQVIRMLWKGDFVSFNGRFFRLLNAKLYTRPDPPPRIHVAASGPKMARVAGEIGDGLYTFPLPRGRLRAVLSSFEDGVRASGRIPEEVDRGVEFLVSYDVDYDAALRRIGRWRGTLIREAFTGNICDPRVIQRKGEELPLEAITERWVVCTDVEDCLPKIEEYIKLGFTRIEVHSSSPDQVEFVRMFKQHIAYLKEEHK